MGLFDLLPVSGKMGPRDGAPPRLPPILPVLFQVLDHNETQWIGLRGIEEPRRN